MRSFLLLVGSGMLVAAAPSSDFNARLISSHNAARSAVGAVPLQWDAVLEARAQKWAQYLAKMGKFEHEVQGKDGENLWMGSKGRYRAEEMVAGWVDEKKDFLPGKFPNVSRTGDWTDVGHYTQLIWRKTTMVGCALASNATDEFLVCRYGPPGNVIGEMMTVAPLVMPSQPVAETKDRKKKR